MVILAMPEHNANMKALTELARMQFPGKIAATAKYDDEVEELRFVIADIVRADKYPAEHIGGYRYEE
jgi:hypothetical protein